MPRAAAYSIELAPIVRVLRDGRRWREVRTLADAEALIAEYRLTGSDLASDLRIAVAARQPVPHNPRNAGRKPRDPSGAGAQVQVRMSPAERAAIEAQAAAAVPPVSMSDLIRSALRRAGILPTGEEER